MGHSLSLLQSSPYPSGCFCCNLCREEGCGPVYHCSDCDFDVHVSCAAVAIQQTHFSHPHHPLHLSHTGTNDRRCDSCGSGIRTWSFRCEICDFDIHSMCARAPRFIKHPRHRDPLVLSNSIDIPGPNLCDGCKMPVTDLFYRCRTCHYNLHQVCATLPSEIKHVKHQAHMLSLIDQPSLEGLFLTCNECRNQVKGWHFHCAICNFSLHPRCADLVHELPHLNLDANPPHERGNVTISASTSVARNVSHAPMPSVSCNVSHTLIPSKNDWEAVERVLRFSQEMAKVHAAQETPPKQPEEEEDDCPTCLEGFNLANPKKSTSCGHHFHLACILEWMEQSPNCPICRKHFRLIL